jgi:hypothetical protein
VRRAVGRHIGDAWIFVLSVLPNPTVADSVSVHAFMPLQSGIVDLVSANDELILTGLVSALRLVMFTLALGLTVISFQAYRQQQSDRLEKAFIGFAFVSMGTAVMVLAGRTDESGTFGLLLNLVETIPFIIGFGMLYRSLYS